MRTGKVKSLAVGVAAGLAAIGVLGPAGVAAQAPAQPAPAPPAEAKGPNTGRVSLSAGIDYATDYYFRGILQEDTDYIFQPYGEVTFKLYEGQQTLNAVGFTLGTWNSLHGGPTGVDGPNVDPKLWYESDFYAKISTTWFEDFTAGFVYTAYMSPNDRFATVQEVALSFGYNDAKLLGPFALNPTLLVAFETKGQADAGQDKGVYMQIGLTPAVTFFEKSEYPLTLSFPLLLGLSLADYYEFGTGDDDTFGFFQGGVAASVPLKFIPADFGAWQVKASLNWLHLGDNLKAINNSDRDEIIATFGIAFTY
ncbi:MAG: hypothetical protein ACREM3_13600 [Candidatus Rokuibacteriota bacterium]